MKIFKTNQSVEKYIREVEQAFRKYLKNFLGHPPTEKQISSMRSLLDQAIENFPVEIEFKK